MAEIQDPKIVSEKVINILGVEVKAPAFNLQNHKVWGASAMIIAELKIVLNQLN